MTVVVLEQQPQLFEGVPVVLDFPAHPLVTVPCLEVQLLPGQRVRAVELVGSLRIAGVAVDGDADQVAGDGGLAGVVELAALGWSIDVAVVVQLGVVMLDDQAGR